MKKKFLNLLVVLVFWGCYKSLPVLVELPDFSFQNQFNQKVGRQELLGKIWIADFIYTGCGNICPLMTQKMNVLEKKMRDQNLRFISITVDPENDTPERLREYASRFGANPQTWFFLTGDIQTLQEVVTKGFKLSMGQEKEGSPDIFHSDRFVLVDKKGRIRGYYESASSEALSALEKDIKNLNREN